MKFTEQEKSIYRFPKINRIADPVELRRKLIVASQGKLTDWIETYNNSQSELEKSTVQGYLAEASRIAFTLPKVTEKDGFTEDFVMECLAHFLEWLSSPLEPLINSPPISQPCMGCP